jgi:hypothetical protein
MKDSIKVLTEIIGLAAAVIVLLAALNKTGTVEVPVIRDIPHVLQPPPPNPEPPPPGPTTIEPTTGTVPIAQRGRPLPPNKMLRRSSARWAWVLGVDPRATG